MEWAEGWTCRACGRTGLRRGRVSRRLLRSILNKLAMPHLFSFLPYEPEPMSGRFYCYDMYERQECYTLYESEESTVVRFPAFSSSRR